MEAFAAYARSRRITINDAIQPHRFQGRGLGIAAKRKIEKGTVLVHVPLSALILPSSRTSPHCPSSERGDIVVARAHAKLATRIAFGDMQGHDGWQATWPTLHDFRAGLPLLWPERTEKLYRRSCSKQSDMNGSKISNGSSSREHEELFAVLPPPVTGLWATVPSVPVNAGSEMKSATRENGGKPLLPSQRAKFNLDLAAAQQLCADLDFSEKDVLDRFTWAWCIVNTRCFYYLAPGVEPPADSDEAMVLCPGIDLFNHASHGCDVTYDNKGFWVRAERRYEAGEEIVTSYGPHGEDTLMVEYGFLMGGKSNEWDGVEIDGVVLATLNDRERKLLEEYGFLGEYTMRRDGVCWRTEVAARCVVMEVTKWDRFVAGRWTDWEEDAADKRENGRKKGKRNGVENGRAEESPKQMASRWMRMWVAQVREEAENSIQGLQAMVEDEVWQVFGTDDALTGSASLKPDQKDLAELRYSMVVGRWEQILDTSYKALKSLESDS